MNILLRKVVASLSSGDIPGQEGEGSKQPGIYLYVYLFIPQLHLRFPSNSNISMILHCYITYL